MTKQSVYFKVEGIDNKHDVKKIKKSLDQIAGVVSVSISNETKTVAVDYDDSAANGPNIATKIEKEGFSASIIAENEHLLI